ncbi:hypothetical protein R1sor_005627 [Riccia sorocarpa]|uniref:Endonuclease/exonuclease/phosphatase domain-containing protein n=1 Tax=Riccia sorocarpa TaxID=122646 RepID=A0ABD3HPD2_9MARC
MGDLNCVELPEDTLESANLLNDLELRHWKSWAREAEMVDLFFAAVTRSGPRFTRQRIKGNTLEYARLDRFYASSGADWIDSVEELDHDRSSGLLDHFPIVATLQIGKEDQPRKEWRTYFKCRMEDVQIAGIKEELKEAWRNNPPSVCDARVRWDLGWQRLKRVLQTARRNNKTKETTGSSAQEQLAEISYESTETIHYLKTATGEMIKDPEEILEETHGFYSELFTKEEEDSATLEESRACLRLIKDKVKASDNISLVSKPDDTEVDRIVSLLPPQD